MTQSLAEYVAAQFRAEMARRNISASQFGRDLGKDDTWVRRRMQGKYEITMSDLELIAGALDVPLGYFLPAASERVA